METAVEVCGLQQCRNAQKRTKWWNEVKKAIKNKRVAFFRWLQQQTPEAKERCQLPKRKQKEW